MSMSNKDIYLSVIIPCYNVERFLPACIASLQRQVNADNWEFIFVNDGSVDNTSLLLRGFASLDQRVVLLEQNNQGVSSARNNALRLIRGEYVLFLDGDDYLSDNASDVIQSLLAQKPDGLLTSCMFVTDEKKLYNLGIVDGLYSVTGLYSCCAYFPTAPMLLYKSEIIKSHKLNFDENIHVGEVYAFTVDYFQYANNILVSHQSFYNYVMHSQSATHIPNYKNDATILYTLHKLYCNIGEYTKIASFHVTAFKLVMSFTYNKYVKVKAGDKTAMAVLQNVFCDWLFLSCVRKVAFGSHSDIKDRLLALYVCFMPLKLGFKLMCMLNILLEKK